jgi:hypothetical protein
MCRVRRRKRCARASTCVNTDTNASAKRSDETAGTADDPWNDDAGAESNGASGNAANKSDRTTGRRRDTAGNAVGDTAGR